MQKRQLGTSDIFVSTIGLGTVKFGRNQGVKYPAAFELPSDHDIQNLLSVAAELGINLLDTAPAYGTSEERLGKAIRDHRHDWVLCTKVGEEFINGASFFDFSPVAIQRSVERSLRRLNTDYLDVVLVHSNGDDVDLIEKVEVFNTLARLKEAGKIRAYGMSTKTIEGGMLTLANADVAMVTFNPEYTEERCVIAHALQQQKSIFVKKALASGHVKATPAEAVQFAVNEPGVTSVIIGTLNAEHLKQNIK